MEAIRDSVMGQLGTMEPLVEEPLKVSMHWRKPLNIIEINQMAPTPEVRARPGRP